LKKKYGEVFLLPSLFSITNIFFGFLSLIFCFHGRFSLAAFWIIAAAVMDGLDGIIARATGAQSDFGTQLDSLADAFSFGAAPSILLYFWGLRVAGTPGILFSFVFLCGGVLRLARYNVLQKTQVDRGYYVGLTVPSASMFLAALVLFHPSPLETKLGAAGLALIVGAVSFCMVSRIKYRNFLRFNFRKRIDLKTALALGIVISGLIFYPRFFLIVFFGINVIYGPATAAVNAWKKRKASSEQTELIS
jgi:CDP-diacylglycerol--serine O-phosphatidyltransferase